MSADEEITSDEVTETDGGEMSEDRDNTTALKVILTASLSISITLATVWFTRDKIDYPYNSEDAVKWRTLVTEHIKTLTEHAESDGVTGVHMTRHEKNAWGDSRYAKKEDVKELKKTVDETNRDVKTLLREMPRSDGK